MDFLPDAEHLSVVDKSAFADVLGKAAWRYAYTTMYLKGHDFQGWNKDKHKLLLLQCHQQKLYFPGWLENQAITATDSCRYSLKLKWV